MKNFSKKSQAIFLFSLLLLSNFASIAATNHSENNWIEETLQKMTLDEKIGQLIMPALAAKDTQIGGVLNPELERNINKFKVGGYHLLIDPEKLNESTEVKRLLQNMQALTKTPLLIAADLEGGAGFYYKDATRLPRAMSLGATRSMSLSKQAGYVTGLEAKELGIQIVFYPDVDVSSNPKNPIINIRSFGSEPKLVSELACAFVRGLRQAGELSVAKHFPGHGESSIDSHLDLPKVAVSQEHLETVELPSFKAVIKEHVDGIMTAHILLPEIEPEARPATLSRQVITGILRKELGFDGLVFSDALMMNGIQKHYSEKDAAIFALQAGVDVLLYPVNVETTFTAIQKAVYAGEITEERINTSVRRILRAKLKASLNDKSQTQLNVDEFEASKKTNQQIAQNIVEQSITLYKDESRVLPLSLKKSDKVFILNLIDKDEGWREGKPGQRFDELMQIKHKNTTSLTIYAEPSPRQLSLLNKLTQDSDIVIVNAFTRVAAFKGSIDLCEAQLSLLKSLSQLKKPVIVVSYGNPYLINFAPELATYVLAYDYFPAVEAAVFRALLGYIQFQGKLPIKLQQQFHKSRK